MELENVSVQENVEITKEDVTMQPKKITNWKAPGLDGILGFDSRVLLANIRG